MNINNKNNDKYFFGLYIVATPIGNLGDISRRAVETIKNADFIICENPNHSLKLLNNLGIKKKLVSLHDHNEKSVIKKISRHLDNKIIVLISDAGSPLISDPGYHLVKHCIKNHIKITTIPGPNSIIPSLQLSGFSLNEFKFLGFFPKNSKQIKSFVEKIDSSNCTTIFFVSSHKIKDLLNIIESKLEKRSISIIKELTKINEKVFRETGHNINKLMDDKIENHKGEFVVVIDGKTSKKTDSIDLDEYNELINKLLLKFSLTDVVEIVHKLLKINKNKIYKWVLDIKKS
tara:strand:+ start:116 stop:982 length:867 start_codon:yes stop_codon:yes gene_type:complete